MEIKVQENPSKMVPKQEKKNEYQELNKPWKSASPRMILQHENETPPSSSILPIKQTYGSKILLNLLQFEVSKTYENQEQKKKRYTK